MGPSALFCGSGPISWLLTPRSSSASIVRSSVSRICWNWPGLWIGSVAVMQGTSQRACKVNFAADVNEKTPHELRTMGIVVWEVRNMTVFTYINPLDNDLFVRHHSAYALWRSMPAKNKNQSSKVRALREEGTFNPTAAKVRDPKFQENEFFDPHDLVQVKYEMLRRVSLEKTSVTNATKEYGVSRPTFYQTRAHFDKTGVAGLVPQKRGPRGPHKLQGEVLAFVEQQLIAGEPVRARELAKLIRQKFDLNLHPRTIERAVAVKKTPR
jgi:transposase